MKRSKKAQKKSEKEKPAVMNEESKGPEEEKPRKRQSKEEKKGKKRVQFTENLFKFFGAPPEPESETLEALESLEKDPRKEILK